MPLFSERLNRLRAAVLGANDGIVSVSAGLLGIGAARPGLMLVAALALILAGSSSMAVGEYVSVRAQVDAEIEAGQVPNVSPWFAALMSALCFAGGALLPALVGVFCPASERLWLIAVSAVVALGLCGWLSALLSESAPFRPTLRAVVGGVLALSVTYGAGSLLA